MKNLSAYKYIDEKESVNKLLKEIQYDDARADRIRSGAEILVEHVRSLKKESATLQKFVQEYDLTTQEGLALMTLAEALLRVPDKLTADALIKDRLDTADWSSHISSAEDILVKLSSVGLSASQKVINSMLKRVGMPVIREATFSAMKILGGVFVLGQSIDEAIRRGQPLVDQGYLYSYDMLGEGARTLDDAQRYYMSYEDAIRNIGHQVKDKGAASVMDVSGISVKLSALHPRYAFAQKNLCVPALSEKLASLAVLAAENGIGLTMDAEEADRLDISLEIFNNVLKDPRLKGYEGFGLAVQAYQKRALPLIHELENIANDTAQHFCIRLVKGAYWDTEIKHAQVLGLSGYPVYTRKANTDLCYLTCAQKLLSMRGTITPMLGTHNAHTVAAILDFAENDRSGFAFQRLHGMAEPLYEKILTEENIPVSIYGPVGSHKDLLPYLVRRLLENGANSSFINQIYDEHLPMDELLADPVTDAEAHKEKRHTKIPMPLDIYKPDRANSAGLDITDPETVNTLYQKMEKTANRLPVAPQPAKEEDIDSAFQRTKESFKKWDATPATERAKTLERFGDLMEENIEHLMAICVKEAGKTIPDAIAEIREAVEFCHYYAKRGIEHFGAFKELPGPTGEQNLYRLRGRGTFVCISPWNFPLAIFVGQVVAALMAGNCVIAKPAEQTPIIGFEAIRLLHEAGVPKDVLIGLNGDGMVGAWLTAHKDVAGVAFTGSTQTAKAINRTLAEKDGPIVPLIAETGGQNAMIVDSTALPEQVVDDALLSGFGSAGQRCSALRLLCLQEDTADTIIKMLSNAMDVFFVGDPWDLKSDIGPVIDENALDMLHSHRRRLQKEAHIIKECPNAKSKDGHFFVPILAEIDDISFMKQEIFGPVIHVLRYEASEREALIEKINDLGFGLTFGFHSRIQGQADHIPDLIRAGNVYVNRSMIGAVVGVQPFGGQGLSGTGPKAGGPLYLTRFATEQTVSIDTTAAGGNTTLISLSETSDEAL